MGRKYSRRRQARIEVFQALHALGEDLIGDVGKQLYAVRQLAKQEDEGKEVDAQLVKELLTGIKDNREEALEHIEQALTVPLETINHTERVVMTLATIELIARPETPKAVVINEWIEVTKEFGSSDGHKLVNVILDNLPLPLAGKPDGD